MLQLKNISKAYATRRKRKIYALNDISLSFPNKGMCVVMGKSGSGKTTLLNVMGGLDANFEGEFVFLGKKLSTAKDFANFRQNYVSFIFQDFNLLEGMTVKQNLEIGYCFANASDNAVETVLNKVGLSGYESRYPRELSGGEQQRVAIARALLKDSKVLLADEPTGNLDPTNSERIYDLLKEISKEKLVIVVSHNVELSEKYADYTVTLKRGKLVSSNLVEEVCCESYVESKGSVVNSQMAFKIAKSEFARRKARSIVTVVLMAICFCVLSFTILIDLQFDVADMHYSVIRDQGYKYFKMYVDAADYHQLVKSGVKTVLQNYDNKGSLHFDSKQAALDAGIEFEYPDQTLELTDDSYYISDALLREIFSKDRRIMVDGVEYEFNFSNFKLQDVIGNKIHEIGYDRICAGIYKTPWGKTSSDLKLEYNGIVHYENDFYSTIITNNIDGLTTNNNTVTVVQNDQKRNIIGLKYDELPESMYYSGNLKVILFADGETVVMQPGEDYSNLLASDEVLLDLNAFNKIFNKYYSSNNLLNVGEGNGWDYNRPVSSKFVPTQLGQKFDIQVDLHGDVAEIKELKLKGILLQLDGPFGNPTFNDESRIYFYNRSQQAKEFKIATQNQKLWVEVSSVSNLHAFLSQYMNSPSAIYGAVYTPASSVQSELADMFSKLRLVLALASAGLVVVAMLSMSILISGQIVSNKRAIGIYKALGARNADIIKIYVYEMLLIAIPIIVGAILFTILVTVILNAMMMASVETALTLIYYKPLNALWTVLSVAGATFIAVFAPLSKIAKLNVIESIKG